MRRNLVIGLLAGLALCLAPVDPAAAEVKTFVGGTGNWLSDGSWMPAGVPQSDDTVVITNGTVALASPTTIAGLTMSGGSLSGNGQLDVSGPITWSGGELGSGGVLQAANGIALTGTLVLKGRTLRVTGGVATLSGAMTVVNLQNDAVFDNQATFAVTSDGGAMGGMMGFSGVGTFANGGTFQKTAAANTGETRINAAFNNSGTVEVSRGTLALAGGGTSVSGMFTVTAPGEIGFSGGGFGFNAATTISGNGAVAFRSNAEVAGTYNVTGSTEVGGGTVDFIGAVTNVGALTVSFGTANFSSTAATITPAALSILGGVLTGSDAISATTLVLWTNGGIAGTGAFTASAGMNLSGSAKTLDQRTVDLTGGTASLSGSTSSIQMTNGATFNIGALATLDCSNDGGMLGSQGWFGNGTLNNAGLVRKSGGTGVTRIDVAFDNSGTVEIQSAALRLGGESNSIGTYGVAADGALELDTAAHEISSGASVTGAGTVRFIGGTSTVAGSYSISGATHVTGGLVSFLGAVNSVGEITVSSGSADFSSTTGSLTATALDLSGGELTGSDTINISGLFTWSGGELQGAGSSNAVANAGAGLQLGDGGGTKRLNNRTLNLTGGTGTMDGATNTVQMIGAASFNNQATFLLSNDGGMAEQGFVATGEASFNNRGIFRKLATGNTGTTRFEQVAFANTGTVELLAGTVRCTAGYTQTMGVTRLNGGHIEVTPALDLQGGVLEGTGMVMGNLVNGGEVRPGTSPGVITVTGGYTQTSSGRLVIEIGGTAPDQFDRLLIAGAAQLGGTLDVRLAPLFVPTLGSMFAILSSTGQTGFFSQVLGLEIGPGLLFSVTTSSTGIVLDVVQGGQPTPTVSATGPATGTPTVSATAIATSTNTAGPGTPSGGPTQSATPTSTATITGTPSASPTATATGATATPSHSPTVTSSAPPSTTPSATPSATPTSTGPSATPTSSPSVTPTPTGATATPSASPTTTADTSASATPTETPTPPTSPTPTDTPTAQPTGTPTATPPISPTSTATVIAPASATATPTDTGGPTATNTVAAGTATDTPTELPTATPTPVDTATATPTSGPVEVTLIIGSASGRPGDTVLIDVSLQTAVEVAGTQNDIMLGPAIAIATDGGQTRCTVNPDIGKTLSSTVSCNSADICTLRALVLAFDNVDPIPNGATLYTCEIAITSSAEIGSVYELDCLNADASDPVGNRLSTTCVSGAVEVGDIGVPTATATEAPPSPSATATVTAMPTDTAMPTLPLPTPTNTRRPSFEDDGCQVAAASTDSQLAWLLLIPALLVAGRGFGVRWLATALGWEGKRG